MAGTMPTKARVVQIPMIALVCLPTQIAMGFATQLILTMMTMAGVIVRSRHVVPIQMTQIQVPADNDTDGTCDLMDTDDDNDGWMILMKMIVVVILQILVPSRLRF